MNEPTDDYCHEWGESYPDCPRCGASHKYVIVERLHYYCTECEHYLPEEEGLL